MKALVLINLCAREYQDIGFERIKKAPVAENTANWLDYLNDAQRAVVLARPDANASVQALALVAGTKQVLPAGSIRLLGATRNMGANGTTPGQTVRFVERAALDDFNREWHTETPASPVDELIYDEKKTPLVFFVSPPAVTPWNIEVELAKAPTDVTDADTGDITLSDVYAGPMQAWMLHRAYAIATQAQNQFQRSMAYYQTFFTQLGVKIKWDMFTGQLAPGTYPMEAQSGRR